MALEDFGVDRTYGQSERWVLLGDLTSSTEFSAKLAKIGATHPAEHLHWVTLFSGLVENLLRVIAKRVYNLPGASIGNTMGDGFLAFGVHGHGSPHITEDAIPLLSEMRGIKLDGDLAISHARAQIVADIRKHINEEFALPELKLKLSVNQGLVITVFAREKNPPEGELPKERRFVGDTINYCARVGSSAFSELDDRHLILTNRFFSVAPDNLQELVRPFRTPITIDSYPSKKQKETSEIYPVPVDDQQFWKSLGQMAGSQR